MISEFKFDAHTKPQAKIYPLRSPIADISHIMILWRIDPLLGGDSVNSGHCNILFFLSSYRMGTGDDFLGGKAGHSPPSSAEFKKGGAMPPRLYVSSWYKA
jgi:hypothetical protein